MKQLSYYLATDEELLATNELLAKKNTIDVLRWAYHQFGKKLVYACSFGAEGIVLIDLISKVSKYATVLFLDTELHFQETYELIEKVKKNYPNLTIQMIKPELSVAEQNQLYGKELWNTAPDYCCRLRKLNPLEVELAKSQAWISGLRREQTASRAHIQYINKDSRFRSLKICPLIHWTWDEIWMYIKFHNLEYNQLHDRSYPSIGCRTCTKPVTEGGDLRQGRWSNFSKTECGLHQ